MYGPFEVLERLGVGGMATVHRAIERGIDGFERVVALKRLLPHLAEDVDFVRAFVREARLASLLQHSNIVQLYELGRVGASYFISMEYIPGRDLRMVLRQARRVSGPPPVEISIALLTELLDALDYAHSKTGSDGQALGLIHRDISPANLIVSHAGHLKVIDFGIAKATFGHLMTNSGKIKGKLSYMAPEVLAGRDLDGRSDLFSASIIAHELLTATPLFAAKDDFQIIDRLQNMQPPPPSVRNPTCPPELDQIVLRGLSKDPAKRWRSAAEMRAALADLAMDQRLLATSRDVCQWADELFQEPVATTSSRRRLPLTAPPAPLGERRRAPGESDEDVMDIVWGMSSPRAAPVVLDEVPDVSRKIPLAAAPPPGPDPLAGRGVDPMMMDPTGQGGHPGHGGQPGGHTGSLSIAERSGDFSSLAVGFGQGMRGAWTTSNFRQVTNPSGWAIGTGPTGQHQQQSQGMLEEAIDAARRAEAMALAAMASHRRRPLVPVLLAAMAVSLAGAATAWFITSGGDEPSAVATAPQGQGATLPPAAVPPPAAPPAPAPNAVAPAAPSAAPPPVVKPAQPVEPTAEASPAEPTDERLDETPEPAEIRRARRARARREARARGKDETRELAASEPGDRPEKADKPDKVATAEPAEDEEEAGQGGAPTTEPAARGSAAQPAPAPKQPAPARVTQPAAKPGAAPAKPSRPAGPIVISSSRAQRLAGDSGPIRFPEGAELPRTITAKLCIDTSGTVTSVTVLSKVSSSVRRTVERALSRWRYKAVEVSGDKVAACFATAFPVKVN